jgi:hypothetical protein
MPGWAWTLWALLLGAAVAFTIADRRAPAVGCAVAASALALGWAL